MAENSMSKPFISGFEWRRFEMKRSILLTVTLIVALVFGASLTAVAQEQHYSMLSASPGGNWYTMVGAAVNLYNKTIEDAKFTIAGTGGSVENARRFAADQGDVGPIYSSNIYELYNSIGAWEGRPSTDAAQVLCQIYDSPHYFVTLANKDINSISDLAGKKVALGAPGSGTSQNSKKTFDTLGIKVKGVELAFGDAARQLQDGKIDALGQGGAPASGIVELNATQDIKFIPFSPEELQKMVSLAPYYFKGELPANTYEGQTEAVSCFKFSVFLAAHKSLPENIAYQILEVTFSEEGQKELGSAHPYWKTVKHNPEAVEQLGVKYHPGAAKYWEEHK
jgi:TRAP transporter TAXI family solute receptor